ncbi:MAG: InlB B-repeat-containing protein, partial [Clostridia bacterium]|nr:InlB B-repeat-containing protein [Clostridia bacterium]
GDNSSEANVDSAITNRINALTDISGGDGDNSSEANVDSAITNRINALTDISGGDGDRSSEANVDSQTVYRLNAATGLYGGDGDCSSEANVDSHIVYRLSATIGLSGGDGDCSSEANVDSQTVYRLSETIGLSGGDGDCFSEANVDSYIESVIGENINLTVAPDGGGSVSGGGEVARGEEITVSAAPSEGYRFVNWTENGTEVSANADYTFTVTQSRELTANFIKVYTVRFENYDGTELQSGEVAVGEMPSYTGSTPEKPGSPEYTYIFTGWTPELTEVTGDATYKAAYSSNPVNYTVKFLVDDEVYAELTVAFGMSITAPEDPDIDYYNFTGWDGEIPATMPAENLTFNAEFTPIEYIAKFVDKDGETVAEIPYTVETESITNPDVPVRDHYTGKWEDYTLAPEGITVKPVYTPVEYYVTFINENGETVENVPYTVETENITNPDVPAKTGYSGAWENYTLLPGGFTVKPVYTAIEYIAKFVDINGETVAEIPYTVETESITNPDVPELEGRTGVWESYTLIPEGITVKPVYEANEYTATFVADGREVQKVTFTYGQQTIDPPAVPAKEGYEGRWESYSLGAGDITINAVYSVVEYTVKFVDENGETVGELTYTVETESIDEPAVPAKDYYTGEWEEYTLTTGNITVKPVYTAIEYTATFLDENGETVGEVKYTVETESITEPAVPEKAGCTGKWEEYTLTPEGITVRPVYENITGIEIKDFKEQSEIGYREDVTYKADATDLPEGAEVHWFVNGEDVGTGESYTVEDPTEDYTIQAKVIDKDGNVVEESSTAKVKVRNGFFDRLKAFFAELIEKILGKAIIGLLTSIC